MDTCGDNIFAFIAGLFALYLWVLRDMDREEKRRIEEQRKQGEEARRKYGKA